MGKEPIFLTHITFHVREYRQTVNFAKVAQKGVMYSPIDYPIVPVGGKKTDEGNSKITFALDFPQDLQGRLDRDEVQLMMPNGGLPICVGRDVFEFIQKRKEAERRRLIHSGRTLRKE